ncbi:hypothetical protein KUTeg_009497 [Tegillarca granosa]|uniref:G-protein coupled receptors family 1 profile domain-containing protein n=1 Tax=Tegillarca granosa TaxID=220873 RepID=A0ABQ9F420_TEGGR|nr:hypothetical protein KUTeg_009497 [Tegillarca granosa]
MQKLTRKHFTFHSTPFNSTKGCQAYGFTGFFCGIVSITTLALMSFVRYISVCKPDLKLVVSRYTSVLIISTYFYGCLWAFPPILGWGDYGIEPHGTSCTLKWTGNRSFVTLMLITCIALPVIIMNICYGLVWNYLRKNTKGLKKWTTGNMNWKKRECYLIKITFTMCCAFMGTWTPYACAYGSDKAIPIRVTLTAILLAKLATVINPLVYFMLNKKFSPYIREYLRITWRTIQFSSTIEERDRQYKTSVSPDVL